MKFFENRKTKGAISIFLVIILMPTMLFSVVLIDGSRMVSAKAMTQEAADLAAASALASYNQDLKDDYGLFAINDNNELEDIYRESLSATLMAYGFPDSGDYSEKIWEILKSQAGLGNPYKGKSFLNLYDFSVDKCTVAPMYSLANYQVLENQMVEYSKFRGIYVMADRFDLLRSLGEMKNQAKENQESSEVMEEKMQADEDNGAVEKALGDLRTAVEKLNHSIYQINMYKNQYIHSLAAEMEVIKFDNIDTDETLDPSVKKQSGSYSGHRRSLKRELDQVDDLAETVITRAETAKKEVEKAIGRLEGFKRNNSGKASANQNVADMIDDAEHTIKDYKEYHLKQIQGILDDQILNRLKDDRNLGRNVDGLMVDIDEAIHAYEKEIDQTREEDREENEITEYYYYYLGLEEKTTDGDQVLKGASGSGCYEPGVNALIDYFRGKIWKKINPALDSLGESSPSVITENFAQGQSGRSGGSQGGDTNPEPRRKVEAAVYTMLPSKAFHGDSDNGPVNNTDFYNKEGNLSAAKSILDNGKSSMILDMGETARDDILCLSYMFGTFKTRLTGTGKFSAEGMPESDKESFYMPKWRYAHTGGEPDMRFTAKKNRSTILRSEIEYLIYGNSTDQANEDAVYATIFAERLANNLIAMYSEKTVVNPACHGAAALACAATAGIVPETVFFWIFLTAWATAETYIEMDYLINGGYKVPFFKKNDNILLNAKPDETGVQLISRYGENGVFVSYEDYLLILLVIKGEQKRLMRSADLIEMNMKAKQDGFSMAQAFTYLRADTDMSIRYLFGSVAPFQSDYRKNGITGRMKFRNTIYLGY